MTWPVKHKQNCDLHGVPMPRHTAECDDTIFGDYSYVECTCKFEERFAKWKNENRSPGAAELPRAIARYR